MSSRRRRRPGRLLFVLILFAAIGGGGWWWFFSGREGGDPEPTITREPTPAEIVMVEPTPRRASLDPVTGDPNLALGDRSTRPTDSSNGVRVAPTTTTPTTTPNPTVVREPEPTPVTTPEPAAPTTAAREAAEEPEPEKPEPEKKDSGSRIAEAMAARTQATMQLAEAKRLATQDPIEARRVLTEAWLGGLSEDDRKHAGTLSRTLADRTLLMDPIILGSPWTRTHTIRPSDTLGGIIYKQKVATSQSFIARINDLDDPNAIKANDELVLPNGRFHAVVDLGSRDVAVFQEIEGGRRDLLLVMPIAIGPNLQAGLDPNRDQVTGLYRVRPKGMRRNPSWKDPATGKMWQRGDVGNPVGEHWISLEALERLDEGDEFRPPVAMHGTSPDTPIDSGQHPGLIAMEPADIEVLFLMLDTGDSTVDIRR